MRSSGAVHMLSSQLRLWFCVFLGFFGVFLMILASALPPVDAKSANEVIVIQVSGVIDQVSSDFIKESIAAAEGQSASAIVIELDTPGGPDTSIRSVSDAIMNSNVPVITYVSPKGARADSGGLLIGLASHVFAMAPGTSTGAAYPFAFSGDIPENEEEMIVNDSVAYIRDLANEQGRNADPAEEAVRNNVYISADEAIKLKVADLTATDLDELLKKADGRTVKLQGKDQKLSFNGTPHIRHEMTTAQRLLHLLADPNIAFLLIILGFYGILFELSAPGLGFGGIAGASSLVLGLYAMQALPVNYTGLALLILAFAVFIADFFSPSRGILTGSGVIAMIAGSLLLFDTPRSGLGVSIWVIFPAVAFTILFFFFVLSLGLKIQGTKISTGSEGLIGEIAVALSDISSKAGSVMLQDQLWQAYTAKGDTIEAGDDVEVVHVKGARVKVIGVRDDQHHVAS